MHLILLLNLDQMAEVYYFLHFFKFNSLFTVELWGFEVEVAEAAAVGGVLQVLQGDLHDAVAQEHDDAQQAED